MNRRAAICIFGGASFLALAAPAALAEGTNVLSLRSDLPEVGMSAIRALGALALVLGIFFGGVWLFRNGQRLAWRKGGAPKLSILESRTLGNRFAIHVVGYEQQRLLISSSPAGITLLSQLPSAPAPEPQPESEANPAPNASPLPVSFAKCLQQVLTQK
jgi:flagellar biogenesis protein FliO